MYKWNTGERKGSLIRQRICYAYIRSCWGGGKRESCFMHKMLQQCIFQLLFLPPPESKNGAYLSETAISSLFSAEEGYLL